MKIIQGDLLEYAKEGKFEIIIHGCNCFHTMGSGIARQIRDKYPSAYQADCMTIKGDKSKLGDYSYAKIQEYNPFIIINAYTQYRFDGRLNGEIDVDYDAIGKVMRKINKDFPGYKIGYPKIGAGLAGGDWNIISNIIDEELTNVDHTLVEYVP